MTRPHRVAWALLLGGCFSGGFASGLPCRDDADCGPELRCEAGVCGGGPPAFTSGSTADPTTSTTSATTGGATAGGSTGPTATSEPPDTTTGESCGIGRCKDFDVLFVLDNSESMFAKQLLVLDFLQSFADELIPELSQACSVHVGTTTTDAYAKNPDPCKELGALVQADNNGDACMFSEGNPYATLADLPQPLSLQCMFNIGTDGSSDERAVDGFFLGAGYDTELNNGCNAAFYRPEAFLVSLFITDEDDDNNDAQGHDGSDVIIDQNWEAALATLKASDDIYLIGLLGATAADDCFWDPLSGNDGAGFEVPLRLRSLIESWPAGKQAIDTMCNRAPGGKTFLPMLQEVRAEIRAACGA